jgi:hypothetical protein
MKKQVAAASAYLNKPMSAVCEEEIPRSGNGYEIALGVTSAAMCGVVTEMQKINISVMPVGSAAAGGSARGGSWRGEARRRQLGGGGIAEEKIVAQRLRRNQWPESYRAKSWPATKQRYARSRRAAAGAQNWQNRRKHAARQRFNAASGKRNHGIT